MIDKIMKEINPDNKEIDSLNSVEFLELLKNLNICLRRLSNDTDVMDENMVVGDLVSPTKEVQIAILEYLVQSLSSVEDKKAKAAMVYYTLLNLHMFSDGNGRVARFMYDLISGDMNEDNAERYYHNNDETLSNDGFDLEKDKGIADFFYVTKIADKFIGSQFDFIPQEVLDKYWWITVGRTNSSPKLSSIIPENVLKRLSSKELLDIDKILRDGYGMKLCPSGLAMLYVSQKKGQLGEWIDKCDRNIDNGKGLSGRLNFSIFRNPSMIADWEIDDFRELVNVGNRVKFARLRCVVDMFVYPNRYVNEETGNTYADEVLGRNMDLGSDESIKKY